MNISDTRKCGECTGTFLTDDLTTVQRLDNNEEMLVCNDCLDNGYGRCIICDTWKDNAILRYFSGDKTPDDYHEVCYACAEKRGGNMKLFKCDICNKEVHREASLKTPQDVMEAIDVCDVCDDCNSDISEVVHSVLVRNTKLIIKKAKAMAKKRMEEED